MKSQNFEFLRPYNPELAELGAFAENYVHSDRAGCLVKLRKFGEMMVVSFFAHHKVPRLPKANFLEMLDALENQHLLPAVILNKFHALRIQGNKAAHTTGSEIKQQVPRWILNEAFDLAKWFALSVHNDESASKLEFVFPTAVEEQEKSKLLRRLAEQEAEMQKLLADLEESRKEETATDKTRSERETIRGQSDEATNILNFNENTTRRLLIDQLLVQAGWDVGPDDKNTKEVGKEIDLSLPSGENGRADYVLWNDDGLPLGVIEAKRTAHDAEKGRIQAKMYAEALERQYKQRPVIFYTNGYDIYIWDDAKANTPRRIYGFYSKESLRRCLWETTHREQLSGLGPRREIIDRRYQIEAVKRVCERFQQQRLKALIVQATGTGKTRVAIALTDLLIRAHWAKRVLFLCDRRELRKQANNAFAEYIDSEPRTYVTTASANDRNKTIYLATYPAMMKCFENFDVGFFDLVIADESHRSIYNRYRDLFYYFDALQVGLTATPRNIISHDTYRMFDCETDDPTAHFSYQEAVEHVPPYLAHFQVTSHTTKFLREGIRYNEMTDEQKQQLEEQLDTPEQVDYAKEKVSKEVFNQDTDRRILRNLMENGVREATGQHVGKSVIFARDHRHAVQLQQLFEELYPQYNKPKKEFCAVIDNYIDHAEQLIDDFKGEGTNDNLTVAISVDMLDTGIDVPEIVNLVFAKPVKSYVKFWQMIGRGTRLCKNLFGPGQHKESFRIFDHWGNFEYFGENPPEVAPSVSKSLLEELFEARLDLAEEALRQQDLTAFEMTAALLEQDIRALPDGTIAVREKWRDVNAVLQEGVLHRFDAFTVATLRNVIAPLMRWREIKGHEENYRTDLLVTRMQTEGLKNSSQFHDLSNDLQEQVSQLPVNLQQVAEKKDVIETVKNNEFWREMTTAMGGEDGGVAEDSGVYDTTGIQGKTAVEKLDSIRRELRGIMHCRNKPTTSTESEPLHIDVTDSNEETDQVAVKMEGVDLAAYRQRVRKVLDEVLENSPVLQRIKAGQPVDDDDIQPLINDINATDPTLRVDDLLVHFPNPRNRLDLAIRQIIGLDAEAVDRHFTQFIQKYPSLTSHQMRFLDLIQKYVANYGRLEIGKLYDAPFTNINTQGVDGVFTDETQIEELLALVEQVNKEGIPA